MIFLKNNNEKKSKQITAVVGAGSTFDYMNNRQNRTAQENFTEILKLI